VQNLPALSRYGDLGNRSVERQMTKEMTRVRAYGLAVSAREIAKVEAVANVTEAALLATSHISAIEALLIGRTPHAEDRLRHVADAGTAGLANIVLKTSSQI
jgi:hypothetical protein